MIVKIRQTASNVKQSYLIEGDGLYYTGKAGSVLKTQPITLMNKTETLKGIYHFYGIKNYIPLSYLFGAGNLTRGFDISRNGENIGVINFLRNGYLKNFYQLTLNDDTRLRCYIVAKESFQYACIYNYNCNEENQIALIETYLNVNDYKYVHKVYLLDDYKWLASIISFFTVYYSSYNFSKRFHMSSGSFYEKSWTLSKYNDKYDPLWRETNFPSENFFGKINLINT